MSQRKPSRSLVRRSAIVAAVALAFTLDARANLLVDGSFEGEVGGHTPNNGSYAYGSTYIPGWTVFGNNGIYNVQWIRNDSYPSINAFDGVGLIDLTGNPDYGPAAVQQDFASTVGTAYRATFYLGYANTSYGANGPIAIAVSMGGDSPGTNAQVFSAGPGTAEQASTVWTQFIYNFTATSASTTLRFEGTTAGNYVPGIFIGLDAIDLELAPVVTPPPVVVVPPRGNGTVPEPASVALLGLGLVGGFFARRRATRVQRG